VRIDINTSSAIGAIEDWECSLRTLQSRQTAQGSPSAVIKRGRRLLSLHLRQQLSSR
jgi:hypothetical protein